MDAGRPSTPPPPGGQPTEPVRKASGPKDAPLRRHSMKDTNAPNERRRPAEEGAADSPDALLPSYTPKQRKTVLKGLRILARAALRIHMERRWPGSTAPPEGEDERQGAQTDE